MYVVASRAVDSSMSLDNWLPTSDEENIVLIAFNYGYIGYYIDNVLIAFPCAATCTLSTSTRFKRNACAARTK